MTKTQSGASHTLPQKIQSFDLPYQNRLHYLLTNEYAMDSGYISIFYLFNLTKNAIPNYITLDEINVIKAHEWFLSEYHHQIENHYFSKTNSKRENRIAKDSCIYEIWEDMIISFGFKEENVAIAYRKTNENKVNALLDALFKFKSSQVSKSPKLSLLLSGDYGLKLKPLPIKRFKLNIEDQYNDDFVPVNDIIVKQLNQKNHKGLVLLHGKQGTGKTTYIRYLISKVKKQVIFMPVNLIHELTSPKMLEFLVDYPNVIFVIEDAENIMQDRNRNMSSPVSTLLNISDGLLSDCLNIQLICTFNAPVSTLDKALLRKGRLIARYEFHELETSKAQILSNKLGFKNTINTPMTIGDIYNQDQNSFEEAEKNKIGF